MSRLLFIMAVFLCWNVALSGQYTDKRQYTLPRKVLPLEKALIKLADAGAPISYRPDQVPKVALRVTGGKRTLTDWLTFLLKDTELIFRPGPAGMLILPDPDLSQRNFTLYGVITDATSGERLIGAAIHEPATRRGELTNEYGFYSLVLKGGRHQLRITYTGYEPKDLDLVLRGDTTMNIALQQAAYLPQIEVRATSGGKDDLYLTESETSIRSEQVNRMNGPGGEADILNIARMLPGITSGADGVGGLIIRGSNSGHNLVLLDGVPVYNLNHAAGLFSIFNSAAIRRADVYKDGVPTRFGGRIGGVLDVHTRDGNLYTPEITVGTSLLAASVTAEGPIEEGKSSFLVSGRYFWGGEILRLLSEQEKSRLGREGQINYAVNDLNLKLNQQVGPRGRIYFSFFRGLDDYGNYSRHQDTIPVLTKGGAVLNYVPTLQRTENVEWGNTVGALRYNHVFNDRFFGNFRLSYSDMLVSADFERSDSLRELSNGSLTTDISSGRFGSEIKQVGAAFDGQINLNGSTNFRFGTSLDLHQFRPQLRSGRVPLSRHLTLGEVEDVEPMNASLLAAYANWSGRWNWLHYRVGIRGQLWQNDINYFNWSPRVVLAGNFNRRNRWRLTYDHLVQPIHLVSSTVIGLPTDLWVPATSEIAPARTRQVSARYNLDISSSWEFEAAIYHRHLKNLVDYTASGLSNEWLDNLSVGDGFANGLELTLSRKGPRFSGWLSYTLAESRRQYDEDINLGRPFPFSYDRRHGVKLLAMVKLGDRTDLTATWRFGSGAYYSFSSESFLLADPAIVDGGGRFIEIVSSKNNFQYPAYHRLDLNLQLQLTKDPAKSHRHQLNVGIYNVYARHNPIFYDLRTNYFSRGSELIKNREFVQIYFGDMQPTLSYRMTFSGKKKGKNFGG